MILLAVAVVEINWTAGLCSAGERHDAAVISYDIHLNLFDLSFSGEKSGYDILTNARLGIGDVSK